MKRTTFFLRTLQIATFIGLFAAALIFLIAFDIIKPAKLNLRPAGPQKSVKIERPVTAKDPVVRNFIEVGDRALYSGNIEEALEAYQRAASEAPLEPAPYEKIGDLYSQKKDYDAAIKNFQFALSLDASSRTLQIKIIQTLLRSRKILDAKGEIEKIAWPTQASLYYKGLVQAFLNEQDKAKESFTQSIAKSTDEKLLANAQKILAIYRDFELARDAPAEYLQVLLANAFDQIGEYGLAIELAFDSLKTKHDYRDSWLILGHAFLNEHKWLDADDAFTKAIDLDSSIPKAFFFRGITRRNMKKYKETIADLEQALKLGWQPKILAKYELAESFFALGNFTSAFDLYKEVAFADPSDINRFIRPMALAINHLQKPEEAIELAKKAYETHPDTAMGHNLLGWAALANNDFGSSREHLQTALTKDPEIPAIYLNLGQLAELEGNTPEALRNYEEAIKRADQIFDTSIGTTARMRYNGLTEGETVQEDQNLLPQKDTQNIPSLSLE